MCSFMSVCQIHSAWLQLSGKIKIHITYCMWHLAISKWFANIHPQNTPTKCICEKKKIQKSKQYVKVTETPMQTNAHLDTTYLKYWNKILQNIDYTSCKVYWADE